MNRKKIENELARQQAITNATDQGKGFANEEVDLDLSDGDNLLMGKLDEGVGRDTTDLQPPPLMQRVRSSRDGGGGDKCEGVVEGVTVGSDDDQAAGVGRDTTLLQLPLLLPRLKTGVGDGGGGKGQGAGEGVHGGGDEDQGDMEPSN